MSVKPPPPELLKQLAEVKVDVERLRNAADQGRELRRAFEERIEQMRSVTSEDLKSRSR